MKYQRGYVVVLTTFLFGLVVSVDADADCIYKISRDFRNIHSDILRGNVSSGELGQLLLETEDTLVRQNPKTNEIEPGLAQSWEYDSVNKAFVFTLNQSCGWSDGSGFIADDVVHGFQKLYSHGTYPIVGGSMIAGAADIIEKGAPINTLQVKALSDYKVSIGIVGDPSAALMNLTYNSYSPLPSHVLNAEHIPFVSTKRASIGPFRVRTVEKDLIVLDKNPHYCSNQKMAIDQIQLVNRKGGYWEFSELMAGRLDMVLYTPEKQLQLLQENATEDSIARVEYIDEQRQTYLMLNPLYEGFVHSQIREKLFSAIDYESIINRGNSFSKKRKIAKTLFYDLPNYENYTYPLMSDNYRKGISSLRDTMEDYGYNKENPFKASIITYPLDRFETVAIMLSSMLKQAHFDINFVKAQSIVEIISQAHAGRYEMFFYSWTLDYSDPQSSLDGLLSVFDYLLREENIKNTELTKKFIDPIKALLVKHKQSNIQTDRFKALQSIEKLIIESSFIIPVYTEHSAIVVSSRVEPLHGQIPLSTVVKLKGCNKK